MKLLKFEFNALIPIAIGMKLAILSSGFGQQNFWWLHELKFLNAIPSMARDSGCNAGK